MPRWGHPKGLPLDAPEHRRALLFRLLVDAMQQEGFALVDRPADKQPRRLVFRGQLVEGTRRRTGLVVLSYDFDVQSVRAALWRAGPAVPAEAPEYTLTQYFSGPRFEDLSRLAQTSATTISEWFTRILGSS